MFFFPVFSTNKKDKKQIIASVERETLLKCLDSLQKSIKGLSFKCSLLFVSLAWKTCCIFVWFNFFCSHNVAVNGGTA